MLLGGAIDEQGVSSWTLKQTEFLDSNNHEWDQWLVCANLHISTKIWIVIIRHSKSIKQFTQESNSRIAMITIRVRAGIEGNLSSNSKLCICIKYNLTFNEFLGDIFNISWKGYLIYPMIFFVWLIHVYIRSLIQLWRDTCPFIRLTPTCRPLSQSCSPFCPYISQVWPK